ncbi:hypothetical protein PENSPDRAFT_759461 [Peniophora sp. CONT]|nr:hypothetical protein PENSPDRAFT_759461 [Peniophora sp. CONT]
MPSPPRAHFNSDTVRSARTSGGSSATEDVAEYQVAAEDAGTDAEYTLPPADPSVLPEVIAPDHNLPQVTVSTPRVTTFAMHPVLAALSRDTSILDASVIEDAERPATSPPTSAVIVNGDGLQWTIRITPTGDSECVTVRNVMDTLRAFFTGAASDEDFVNASNPDAVTRAFHARTHRRPDLYNAGTIRADYLQGPIIGLSPIACKDEATCKLVFSTGA